MSQPWRGWNLVELYKWCVFYVWTFCTQPGPLWKKEDCLRATCESKGVQGPDNLLNKLCNNSTPFAMFGHMRVLFLWGPEESACVSYVQVCGTLLPLQLQLQKKIFLFEIYGLPEYFVSILFSREPDFFALFREIIACLIYKKKENLFAARYASQ